MRPGAYAALDGDTEDERTVSLLAGRVGAEVAQLVNRPDDVLPWSRAAEKVPVWVNVAWKLLAFSVV